jgi:hypothetical protein
MSKQAAERQEGQEGVGDKPLPEVRQLMDHKAHLLSQRATPKVKLKNKE